MIRSMALAALAIFAIIGGQSAAQEMTDEEMLARFRAQQEALNSFRDGSGGLTRGLSIVTVDDQGSAVDGNQNVQISPEDISGATFGHQLADPNQPLVAARFPDTIAVELRIEFDFDSAAISRSQEPVLAQICRVIKASDIGSFLIVGHTDSSGSDAYNQRLSQLRADEVGRSLHQNCGISRSRLQTIGHGERFPSNSGDPKAAENRRVEFQALS